MKIAMCWIFLIISIVNELLAKDDWRLCCFDVWSFVSGIMTALLLVYYFGVDFS